MRPHLNVAGKGAPSRIAAQCPGWPDTDKIVTFSSHSSSAISACSGSAPFSPPQASGIQQITIGWAVYDLTGSGTPLNGISGMRSFAVLGFGPFARVVVDRVDWRFLTPATKLFLLVTNLALEPSSPSTASLSVTRSPSVLGEAQVLDRPLRQITTFDLVPAPAFPTPSCS